jgi:hypothetical protein
VQAIASLRGDEKRGAGSTVPGRQMLSSVLPAHLGEVLLTRSLKVATVLVVAFAMNRLARWMVRRLVRGLQQQQVQQRLASIQAKTPGALRSTEPLPSLRRSQRADACGGIMPRQAATALGLARAPCGRSAGTYAPAEGRNAPSCRGEAPPRPARSPLPRPAPAARRRPAAAAPRGHKPDRGNPPPTRGLVPPASQESAASPVRVSVSTVVVTSATARPVTRVGCDSASNSGSTRGAGS